MALQEVRFLTSFRFAAHPMKISILGSGSLETNLPREFAALFKDGVAINRHPEKYGHPHEMGVYHAYLGLKALECSRGEDHAGLRRRIVEAVTSRLKQCDGLWSHPHFQVDEPVHGLRSTSAAIRLLIEAFEDGLLDDSKLIHDALLRHLSYSETLAAGGLWFYHDSLEAAPGNVSKRWMVPNEAYGSSKHNALVLNTHLDTLLTVGHAVTRLASSLDAEQTNYLQACFNSGIEALSAVLAPPREGRAFRAYQRLDGVSRSVLLRDRPTLQRVLANTYFAQVRPRLRRKWPCFSFADGYLERDLSYSGRSLNYHVVNLLDALKLARYLGQNQLHAEVASCLLGLARRATEYASAPPYFTFMTGQARTSCFPIQFCEALYILWQQGECLSPERVENFIRIRKTLAPSPALLGYDPTARRVDELEEAERALRGMPAVGRAVDVLPLSSSRVLVINNGDEQVRLPEIVAREYALSRMGSTERVADGRLSASSALVLARKGIEEDQLNVQQGGAQ